MTRLSQKNILRVPLCLDRIYLTPEQRMECKRLIDLGRMEEVREIIEKALEGYGEIEYEKGLRV